MPATDRGQATVELVALLPALALVAALSWQCVLAGQSIWLARTAAGRAARAVALAPPDPSAAARQAARGALPSHLARGVRASLHGDAVLVSLAVPSVIGGELTTVRARAHVGPW